MENIPEDDRMIKLCSDAGFMKTVAPGQYLIIAEEVEFSKFDGRVARREYTLSRDDESSWPKGWIRENTEFGPVLEVTTSYHQGRSGIEIKVDSLSGDGSHSWMMIFNGLDKFVRKMTERTQIRDDTLDAGTGRPVAKSRRPKQTSVSMSSSVRATIPIHERKWIDVEPVKYDSHGSLPREEDGAVELRILAPMFASRFGSSPHWSVRLWLGHLQRGGGPKKRFQCCLDSISVDTFL